MSFREWLPITRRNRVALLLAFAALVMFVVWNCLPYYDYHGDTEPDGIMAMTIWPDDVLSPGFYITTLKSPDVEGFLVIAAFMAIIQNALVTLAAVPFWKALHASPYIRLPLAVVNFLGGAVVLWHLHDFGYHEQPPNSIAYFLLTALSMFALSAALFTFKNELALREEKGRPQAGPTHFE